MDEDSGDVVAFNVVQVSEVSSSNAMEKEGFSRCLQDLEEKGIMINRIATDRHVSISSSMKKDFPHINHQYDVWHLSKWVVKKRTNKANKRVVRNWPHGYNPFPITFGGAQQPAMGMCSFCVKSGSLF